MQIPIYQIDAFASERFKGNPAAVCLLDDWLPDEILQKIAQENNISETAFLVKENDLYHIRWFTPTVEVDLCGHATLASAFVVLNEMQSDLNASNKVTFSSKSGALSVTCDSELLVMDFPATEATLRSTPKEIIEAFGKEPLETLKSDDYMAVYEDEEDISTLSPDYSILARLDCRGIIATSKGKNSDFVSRFFAPRCGINEDPVTGSAHCTLAPYWANKLGKNRLSAKQLSKRGGELMCEYRDNRVLLSGRAIKYLEGKLYL